MYNVLTINVSSNSLSCTENLVIIQIPNKLYSNYNFLIELKILSLEITKSYKVIIR